MAALLLPAIVTHCNHEACLFGFAFWLLGCSPVAPTSLLVWHCALWFDAGCSLLLLVCDLYLPLSLSVLGRAPGSGTGPSPSGSWAGSVSALKHDSCRFRVELQKLKGLDVEVFSMV